MHTFVRAGAGFLLVVLWFDLMFDVQTRRYPVGPLPPKVLASMQADLLVRTGCYASGRPNDITANVPCSKRVIERQFIRPTCRRKGVHYVRAADSFGQS